MGAEFTPKEKWMLPLKGIEPIQERIDDTVKAIKWATTNDCSNLETVVFGQIKRHPETKSWRYNDVLYLTERSYFSDQSPTEILGTILEQVREDKTIKFEHPDGTADSQKRQINRILRSVKTQMSARKEETEPVFVKLNSTIQIKVMTPSKDVTAFAIGFTPEDKAKRRTATRA